MRVTGMGSTAARTAFSVIFTQQIIENFFFFNQFDIILNLVQKTIVELNDR